MKFKIGDIVRYIGEDLELKNKIYKIVDVSEKCNRYTIYNNIDGHWAATENKLELVQKNIDSDKKDLIRNLINEYLSDNETSIREELFLRGFQDYCLEKLGDDVNGLVNRNEKE